MSDCVIEVGHPKGTPADWVNADDPEHTVCDHHKYQTDTAYNDYNITWNVLLQGIPDDNHPEWCKCQRVCGGDQ